MINIKYGVKMVCVMFGMVFGVHAIGVYAQEPLPAPADLAAESEAYCASTAQERPTPPQIIVEKIHEACALVEQEGQVAFPKFKGKQSPFIFEGTYIWIHSLNGSVMLVHPVKYKMEGNSIAALKDKNGKHFLAVMNTLAREQGEGWVEYIWPEPGTNEFIRKISYVKKCTLPDGTDVVAGSGIYNFREEDFTDLEVH